jgi:hypothetical protein
MRYFKSLGEIEIPMSRKVWGVIEVVTVYEVNYTIMNVLALIMISEIGPKSLDALPGIP